MTDTATRIAGLPDVELHAMHARMDSQGVGDPAVVEVHHLVTTELLKRGVDHGHERDEWARAVVLVEKATVDGPDEIEAPEGFAEAFDKALVNGGTVSVLLTVDGYMLKADPTVSDVHVDAVMGSGRRRRSIDKADGYDVPSDVQAAARQALKWIADGRAGDGFTSVGRGRARQLADGGSVDRGTLVKMRAYFARHIVDKDAEGWGDKSDPTPGMVAWYAWGGDAGRAWANRVLGDVEKAYDPDEFLTPKEYALYEAYESVAEAHGAFTPLQAHYMSGKENPFAERGMNCANCVFYEGGGGCEILTEQVEPGGLCKLWVISENLLTKAAVILDDEEDFLASLSDDDKRWYEQVSVALDAGGDPDVIVAKRGNPEALRDYWRGGGKGKISWGGGGDFTACVAAVGKYMTSEQAKGYCAIRHREVTGMWPGDKRNRTKKSVDGVDTLPVAPVTGTFSLPGGVTYTLDFAPSEPVVKHPGHSDQKAHAGRGGMEAGVAESIVSRVRERGGLSVSMVDGSEPPTGYMVARTEGVKPAVVEADDFYDPVKGPKALGSFLKQNRDQLTGGDYLGVWHDPDGGKVYLDVSQNVKSRGRAERLGAERNQISIWDVVRGKEIPTGGTGEIAKADSGDQVAGSVDDDGRGDRRLRGGDLGDADAAVVKHGEHDQQSHAGGRGRAPKRTTPKGGKGEPGTTIDSYPEATRRAIRRKPAEVQFAGETIVKGRDSAWDHLVPDGEGGYRLTPERRKIHEEIIANRLEGVPTGQENPEFVMMGGGGGSGKGTLLKSGKIEGLPEESSRVHIDVDEIKIEIPDYGRMVGEGRKTDVAGWTHQESSIIGKEVQRRAIDQRSHILLDGTGDSAENSLRRKIEDPRAAGYRIRGEYVTAPVQQAWTQNIERAANGPRGLVPPGPLLDAHKSVSAIVPKMAPEFDEFRLWDSSGGRGNQVVIATASRGEPVRVKDRKRYKTFLDKADDPISTDEMMSQITPEKWQQIRDAR